MASYTEKDGILISNSEKNLVSFSEMKIEKQNSFVKLNLEESTGFLLDEGKPMLPFVVKSFIFPENTRITSINCNIIVFKDELIDSMVLPACEALPKSLVPDEISNYKIDSSIYSNSEFYPDRWYDYSITSGFDGVKLSIRFYPLRYNPDENLIRSISDVEIDIDYDFFVEKQVFSEEHDMVIIAPVCFSNLLRPLVNHKNSIGVDTFLKTTEEIYDEYPGRDDAEKIKYFIKDAIETYNISYVLLVGGLKGIKKEWYIPVRETNLDDGWESGYISDLYYSDIYRINQTTFEKEFDDWDSNDDDVFAEWGPASIYPEDVIDFSPDVHVGRLACRSKREVRTVVNKIISYERRGYGSPWLNRMICVGGDTVVSDNESENISEGEFICDQIADIMQSDGYDITKLYTSDWTLTGPFSVIKRLNSGAGFAYFNGHGNPSTFVTYPYNNENDTILGINTILMNLLFNRNRLPIVFVVGCHNSQFNVTPVNLIDGIKNQGQDYFRLNTSDPGGFFLGDWIRECWSWKFISVRHGGAIATIGNTALGYGLSGSEIAFSDLLSVMFFDVLTNQSKETLGEVYSQTIADYISSFGVNDEGDEIDRKTVDSLVLLGDPSLKIK